MDFGKVSDLLSPGNFLAFLLLVAPGFVAIRTMEARISGERRKASDALIDIVMFSLITDVLWGAILRTMGYVAVKDWPLWSVPLIVFVTPVVLAVFYAEARRRFARAGLAVDLEAKPWDWVFNEHLKQAVQIVLTLSDGRRIGGKWQEPSFASGYPAPEQLFFSVVYSVDPDTGELIEPIPHHRGVLVDKASVSVIEFFDYDRPLATPKAAFDPEPNL